MNTDDLDCPIKNEPHPFLDLLLNGVPLETEVEHLRARIADCERRYALVDRTMPAVPAGVGDGNTTEILILLELRSTSSNARTAMQAGNDRAVMLDRLVALERVSREERAISVEYSEARHRLNKIQRMARGLPA